MPLDLSKCIGFQWDEGNRHKNKIKHNVRQGESEQIFFNTPLLILDDANHSTLEDRYAAFGKTNRGRLLAVIFTVRDNLIRVISARDMNKHEKELYEKN